MATETPHKSCSFTIPLTFDVSILGLSREENVLQCVQIIMGMHAYVFISHVSEPSIGQQVLLVPSAHWCPSALRPAGWWQLNLEMLISHRVTSKWPGAEAIKHRNSNVWCCEVLSELSDVHTAEVWDTRCLCQLICHTATMTTTWQS